MKKQIVLMAFAACAALMLNSCGNAAKEGEAAGNDSAKVEQTADVYTCSMHPDVKSDKPGTCSQCGMELEKAK